MQTANTQRRALGQRLAVWGGATVLWALGYFATDHLYAAFDGRYHVRPDGLTVAVALVWFAATLALRSAIFAWAGALFFAALQWAQFLHYGYFGAPIAPHEPPLLFQEWREIVGAFDGLSLYFWPALLLPVLPLAAFALLWRWNQRQGVSSRLRAALVWLLLVVILPVKAHFHPKVQAYYPKPYGYALKNVWLATAHAIGTGGAAAWAAKDLPAVAYTIERVGEGTPGVMVLVMGESTNPARMSVFGYERDTTPFLRTLVAKEGALAAIGQSAGVNTKVTLPMFFNLQGRPWEREVHLKGTANLIRLAKANGYRVIVVSAQTNNLFTFTRAEEAEVFCTVDRCFEGRPQAGIDTVLWEALVTETFDRKTLLVVHTRVAHSAYDTFVPRNWAPFAVDTSSREARMRSTYDNAIAWFDEVVRQVVATVRARSTLPVTVVLTGDHNELLGEDGQWGHGLLAPSAGEVPVLVAAFDGAAIPDEWRARLTCRPSHAEVGTMVAEWLGWRVSGPPVGEAVVYTNGPELSGSAGWVEVTRMRSEAGCYATARVVMP